MDVIWKNCKENLKYFIFHLKIDFYIQENILLIWNTVYPDRSELNLSDRTMRIQHFYFSQIIWWKNCGKLPKLLRCRETHNFKTIKDIIPNVDSIHWRLEKKVVLKVHVSIFYTFREISRLRALLSGRAGSSFYMIQLALQ